MSRHVCWMRCPLCDATLEVINRYRASYHGTYYKRYYELEISSFGNQCACLALSSEDWRRREQALISVTTDLPYYTFPESAERERRPS